MAKTRQQKEEAVEAISSNVAKAKSIVFTDYRGLTMNRLSIIRNQLKEQDAKLVVTKNTLLKIALKNSDKTPPDEGIFEGPIATLFAYQDEIGPIKILVRSLKDTQLGKIKGGFLGVDFISASSISKLAILPTKQGLQTKLVGSLSSPLYSIVGVLQANLRGLVYALDQIKNQNPNFGGR